MLPMLLDVSALPVALIGGGDQSVKRLALLDEARAARVAVYAPEAVPALRAAAGARLQPRWPGEADLLAASVVFIADLAETEAAPFVALARRLGRLVNTEDRRALCDFHVPAMVRRGDLLLTVSTGGRSPGLASRLRRDLEARYPSDWAGRLERLSAAREAWRAEGLPLETLAARTDALIAEEGWLS